VQGQNIAIGLFVCTAAIAIALFSHSWVTASQHEEHVGLGPLGMEFCEEDHCQSAGWGDAGGKIPGDITAMAYLSLIAGLGGAALCGFCGLMIFNRQPAKAPWKLARGVISAAAGFSAFFTVRIFTMPDSGGGLGPGWALIVGLGGMIAAGILTQKVSALAVAMPSGPPGGMPYGGAPPGANPYGGAPPGANPYGGAPPGGNPYGGAPAGNPYGAAPQQPPQHAPQQAAPMGTAPTVASGAQPAPAAQTHPCPRCQRPLVYVAQYQRWFCESCKQYA
jgi:hypothetical protein